MRIVSPCWRPSVEGENSSRGGDVNGRVDGLLWYKDSGEHVTGEFSMAVIQANNILEDHSQLESGPMSSVESGPHGTFVGIYDGHGGPETARFINEHLFGHIKSMLFFLLFAELNQKLLFCHFNLDSFFMFDELHLGLFPLVVSENLIFDSYKIFKAGSCTLKDQ